MKAQPTGRIALAVVVGLLVLAGLLMGCANTPGQVGLSVTYDMQQEPAAVSASVDWRTWFRSGYVAASLSTTGAMSATVTIYLRRIVR